jgi:hypothetical protein
MERERALSDPAGGTLDDRLARLAALRSAKAKPEPHDHGKRHAAATGRLVAAWLSASTMLRAKRRTPFRGRFNLGSTT